VNRRHFFGMLTGAAASAALLELAGSRRIFLPPRGGWPTSMASIWEPYQQQVSELMRRSLDVAALDAMLYGGSFVKVGWDGHRPIAQVIPYEAVFK